MNSRSKGKAPEAKRSLTSVYGQILSDMTKIEQNPKVFQDQELRSELSMASYGMRLWVYDEQYERLRPQTALPVAEKLLGPAMLYSLDLLFTREISADVQSSRVVSPDRQSRSRGTKASAHRGSSRPAIPRTPTPEDIKFTEPAKGVNLVRTLVDLLYEDLGRILSIVSRCAETHDDQHLESHMRSQAVHLRTAVRDLYIHLPAIDRLLAPRPQRQAGRTAKDPRDSGHRSRDCSSDTSSSYWSLSTSSSDEPESDESRRSRTKHRTNSVGHTPCDASVPKETLPSRPPPRKRSVSYTSRNGAVVKVEGLESAKTTVILRQQGVDREHEQVKRRRRRRGRRKQPPPDTSDCVVM